MVKLILIGICFLDGMFGAGMADTLDHGEAAMRFADFDPFGGAQDITVGTAERKEVGLLYKRLAAEECDFAREIAVPIPEKSQNRGRVWKIRLAGGSRHWQTPPRVPSRRRPAGTIPLA